jgi:hypothetical protein
MVYFYAYVAFALATSFSSLYEIFWPILRDAKQQGIINDFTDSPWLSSFVVFSVNIVLAPAIFFTLMIPSLHIATHVGIASVVLEPRKTET